jgi:hypothetical protein
MLSCFQLETVYLVYEGVIFLGQTDFSLSDVVVAVGSDPAKWRLPAPLLHGDYADSDAHSMGRFDLTETSPFLSHFCLYIMINLRLLTLLYPSDREMRGLPLAITIGFVVLSLHRFSCSADTQGFVRVYSNDDCTSSQNTTISLLAGTCLETNQTTAIAIISLPSCPTGQQPRLYISDQEGCGRPSFSPAVSSGSPGECLYLTSGRGIASAAFVCNEGPTPGADTSTPGSAITPTAQPLSGQGSQASSGLSRSDSIALGCAIAFGVPGLILAALSLKKRIVTFPHGYVHGNDANDPPPPYGV